MTSHEPPASIVLEAEEPALAELPRLRRLSTREQPPAALRQHVLRRLESTLATHDSKPTRRSAPSVLLAAVVMLAVPSAIAATPLGARLAQRVATWLGSPPSPRAEEAVAPSPPKSSGRGAKATSPRVATQPSNAQESPPEAPSATPAPEVGPPASGAPRATSATRRGDAPPSVRAATSPKLEPAPSSAGEPRETVSFSGAGHSLPEERRLLEQARLSLSAGDASTALRLADEHRRRFPNGLLRQERETIQVRAQALPSSGEKN